MHFELTVLGCNSALPAHGRHPSAHIFNGREELFLIDCGEATQIQLRRYHIRANRIRRILISHLHGDHFFGLIGLLTSLSLNGRNKAMTIFSPSGLEEIIRLQLSASQTELSFPLEFVEIRTEENYRLFETKHLEVFTFPLIHRIPTCGFLFREKPLLLNVDSQKLKAFQVPVDQIKALKEGKDFITPEGKRIPNRTFTLPRYISRSFAYCSDTLYTESILPYIKEVDLLYHEATFGNDKRQEVENTLHSTAAQAAMIARKAGARKLIIGHFSSRYRDLSPLLSQARAVFPNTFLAEEGKTFDLPLRRDMNHPEF
jgi:ribonuclease Z